MTSSPDVAGKSPKMSAPRVIRARDVALNGLSSYGGQIAKIGIFIFLLPFVISHIGKQSYGLWSLVWAVVSVLSLVDLGFGQCVVKFVADARGRGDDDRLKSTVCTLFWIYVLQMLLIWLLVLGAWMSFTSLFDVEGRVGEARMILLIVGGGFALGVPFGMFRGVLSGHQRQWIANSYEISGLVLYAVLALWAIPRSPRVETLAWVSLTGTLVPLIALAFHAIKSLPGLSLRPRWIDRGMLRQLWSHSFFFMLMNVSTLIYTRVDTFVIKGALSLSVVAVYALAMQVSENVGSFCVHVSRVLSPVVAELHSAQEKERLIDMWIRGTKVATGLAAPLVVGCMALAEPLIVLWAGAEFSASVRPLRILLAAVLVSVVHSVSGTMLAMGGQQKYMAVAMLASQAANVALSLLWVRWWGIVGVAAATLCTTLPVHALILQRRLGHLYGLSRIAFYRHAILPNVFPCAVILAFLLGWQEMRHVATLFEVAALEAVACLLFWSTLWRFGLSGKERDWMAGAVRAAVGRRIPEAATMKSEAG